MRTWRQGVLGKIVLPDSTCLYLKCLKYPLAIFYEHAIGELDSSQSMLFSAFLELSVLPSIERYGVIKLTKAEKQLNLCFSMDFETDEIRIDNNNLRDIQHCKTEFDFPNTELQNLSKIQRNYLSLNQFRG